MSQSPDYLIAKIEELHIDIKEIKRLLELQNGRIRKLEIFRGWLTGAVSVCVVVVGITIKYIHELIGK